MIMKTRIFKKVLPFVAIALAITGAFAFSKAPTKPNATFVGWYQISDNPVACQDTEVTCSDINTRPLCTDGTHNLKKINSAGTACSQQLYEE
jgi:hypothetical protein